MKYLKAFILLLVIVLNFSCATMGGSDCVLVPGTLICIEK